jgi:Serine carboxypeptidase S28
LANDEFYQPGGPIFIFVGGEWAIEESFIQAGHTYDMAKEMNAYLLYTEHRYYGKTHPTE